MRSRKSHELLPVGTIRVSSVPDGVVDGHHVARETHRAGLPIGSIGWDVEKSAGAVADRLLSLVVRLVGLLQEPGPDVAVFSAFVERVEPALRQALVATYGPVDGREATVEALSWAWEYWDRLADVDNQVGYLYRVGQTATRRFAATAVPSGTVRDLDASIPEIEPGLVPALDRLSEQQRLAVLLVHAFGWTQADVARVLDINPSTVREHLTRGMTRLRRELEVRNGE